MYSLENYAEEDKILSNYVSSETSEFAHRYARHIRPIEGIRAHEGKCENSSWRITTAQP